MNNKSNTLATITLGVLLAGYSSSTIANTATDPQILKNIEHIKLAFQTCGETSGETDQYFLDCSAQTKEEMLGVIGILNNPFWKNKLLEANNLNPNVHIKNIQFRTSKAIKISCKDIKSNIPVVLYTDTNIVESCMAGETFEKPTANSITPLLQQPNIQDALKYLQHANTLADALQIIVAIPPNFAIDTNAIQEFIKKNMSSTNLFILLLIFELSVMLKLTKATDWKDKNISHEIMQKLQANEKIQFLWRKISAIKSALKKKKEQKEEQNSNFPKTPKLSVKLPTKSS